MLLVDQRKLYEGTFSIFEALEGKEFISYLKEMRSHFCVGDTSLANSRRHVCRLHGKKKQFNCQMRL